MSTATPPAQTVARRLIEASDTDLAAFFDFFTDETVFRLGNNETVIGRDNIIEWASRYLRSVVGLRHEVLDEFSGADTAVLCLNVTYTMASGTSFTIPAVGRSRVEHGKVVEYQIYMDPTPVVTAS
ncbi:nuclear transport factor 2 family protein [Rhodococcus pyridinivorans]|uniref:nuclear transport factor 2 family protein n=1 Tax=Rhodococcus TaxID=1827 RepID=UPI001C7D58F7|nr:nuclear transport factor 2 family protein [Rhodococcus sp. DMU2021]MBX4171482.1 nuclear transport factor 2 family protein [Rhodococcus sp. DMU2021]